MSSMSTLLNDARNVVGQDYSLGDLFTDIMTLNVRAANSGANSRSYDEWLEAISSRHHRTVRKIADAHPIEDSAPQVSAV